MMTATRFVLGGASWFIPLTTMRLMGIRAPKGASAREVLGPAAYGLRLFGVRDIALGISLVTTTGEQRRFWWKVGLMCDTADTLAAVIGTVRNELPPNKLVRAFLIGSAAVGIGLGAAALALDDV